MADKQYSFVGSVEGTKDMGQWLCDDCGKGLLYRGQIAGTCAKDCEKCGACDKLLKKYAKHDLPRLL